MKMSAIKHQGFGSNLIPNILWTGLLLSVFAVGINGGLEDTMALG